MDILAGVGIHERLKEIFSRARRTIRIVSPWIKGEVLRDLLSGVREGVKVQVILRCSSEEDLSVTDPSAFIFLREIGAEVFLNRKVHAKFFTADSREAVLGSANLTPSGVMGEGNVEVAVHIKERKKVKELEDLFESLKRDSYSLSETVGLVLSLSSAREGELVLLEDLPEQTYVRIPMGGNFAVCRIYSVRSGETELRGAGETEEDPWLRARLVASFVRKGGLRLGRFEVLGEYERERGLFKTPVRAPRVGSPVERLGSRDPDLRSVMLKNHSGYPMGLPVYVGKVMGSEVDAFLDLDKVVSMHMAVLGTTGSGKTTFVKKVLRNLKGRVEVFLLDMYGEYEEDLGEEVKVLTVPNVLMPVDWEDVKRILREGGAVISERSSEEREFFAVLRRSIKPDLRRTALREAPLDRILLEAVSQVRDRGIREGVADALAFFKETFGPEVLADQPLLIREVLRSLEEGGTVVYSFREVDLSETRVAVGGLIIRELLRIVKGRPRDRLVVIEEAHNFAPERGLWEVQAGRENLAYTALRRVAMEGRKFRLGLIAITQRPANISKFILSQLNTQVIFKLITKNDLEAVSVFFEPSKEDIFRILPSLKPGTAFLTGLAVPFGFLFRMEEIPYW
jgi:DNA helicase HerA-like ATPase